MLVLLVIISMVVSSDSGLAGVLRRTKRSTGNCILSSTHRDDIFPKNANREIMCNKSCHSVTTKVKYAKIEIKEETVVIGCRNTIYIPNNETYYNPWTKKPFLSCKTGFKNRTESVPVLHENGDRWETRYEQVLIDCQK